VFPKWLNGVIEYPDGYHYGELRLTTPHDGLPPKPRSLTRFATRFIGVRGICRSCNNGWMSRVETAAMPLLASMINGHRTYLNLADQLTVARWTCVKVCEADSRRGRAAKYVPFWAGHAR